MRYSAFEQEFARRALRHNLWRHPWFTLVRRRPTLARLQTWATQAGMIDESFVKILTRLRANPLVPLHAHPAICRNLADELGHGHPAKEHFQMFRGVLSALGVTLESYRRARPLPGTQVILRGLGNAAEGDPVRALAVMASEEFICPREFPRLMRAITRVVPGRSAWQPYFTVHCESDIGHASDLLAALFVLCRGSPAQLERALACEEEDLNWNVLFYDSLVLAARR